MTRREKFWETSVIRKRNISSAIEDLLNEFFLIQKDIESVSGLFHTIIKEAEYAVIKKTMKLTDRNKRKTAKILGISRNTLDTKIKKLNLKFGEKK